MFDEKKKSFSWSQPRFQFFIYLIYLNKTKIIGCE